MALDNEQLADMQADQDLQQLSRFNIPVIAEQMVLMGALTANSDGTFARTKMTHQQQVDTDHLIKLMMAQTSQRGVYAQLDGSVRFNKNAVNKFREKTLNQMMRIKLVDEIAPEQEIVQEIEQDVPQDVIVEAAVEVAPLPDLKAIAPVHSEQSMKDIIQNLVAINEAHPGKSDQKMSKEANLATKDYIKQIMVDMGHPAVTRKNGYSPKKDQYNKYDAAKVDVKEIHKFHDEMVALMKNSTELDSKLSLVDGQLSTFKPLIAEDVAEKLQEHGYLQRNEAGEFERATPAGDAVSRGRRERYMTQLMSEMGDSAVTVNKRNELNVSKENLRAFEEKLLNEFAPSQQQAAPAASAVQAESVPVSQNDAARPETAPSAPILSVVKETEKPKTLFGKIVAMTSPYVRKAAAVLLLFGAGYAISAIGGKNNDARANGMQPDKNKTSLVTGTTTTPALTSVKSEMAKPVIAAVKAPVSSAKRTHVKKHAPAEVQASAEIRRLPQLDAVKSISIVPQAPQFTPELKMVEIRQNSISVSKPHRSFAGRVIHTITHPFEHINSAQQEAKTMVAVEKTVLPASVSERFQSNKSDTTVNTNMSSTMPGVQFKYNVK